MINNSESSFIVKRRLEILFLEERLHRAYTNGRSQIREKERMEFKAEQLLYRDI